MQLGLNRLGALGRDLYLDTRGFIISAELIVLSSLLVVGLIVGMTALQQSVNAEMNDVADAFGSLNQSFCYSGMHGCYKDWCCQRFPTSRVFGSCFTDTRDECDNNQCELTGELAVVETPRAAVVAPVPVPDPVLESTTVPPIAVIQKEDELPRRTDIVLPPTPIMPTPDALSTTEGAFPDAVVVPPYPGPCSGGCQKLNCGCAVSTGCHCQGGSIGNGYGWGYGVPFPYENPYGAMMGRVAPNAMGGAEYGGGYGYGGFSDYHQGYGDGLRFPQYNYGGYYRVLIPN